MSGFNPLTLAPFGEEHEEETGDEAGSRRRYNLERILIGCRLTRVIIKPIRTKGNIKGSQ